MVSHLVVAPAVWLLHSEDCVDLPASGVVSLRVVVVSVGALCQTRQYLLCLAESVDT